MDIKYKVFPKNKKKCIEIEADDDKYGTALRLIGCRRVASCKNNWTLNRDNEERLEEFIKKLGGNPSNQKILLNELVPKKKKRNIRNIRTISIRTYKTVNHTISKFN